MVAYEKVFPLLIATVCLLMLVRLFLGARLRHRLDQAVLGAWRGVRQRSLKLIRWHASRKVAAQATEEAIRRARRPAGQWEGNVYKPDSFKRPDKRRTDKPH